RGGNRYFTSPTEGWFTMPHGSVGAGLWGLVDPGQAVPDWYLQQGKFIYSLSGTTAAQFDTFTISDGVNGSPDAITRTVRIAIHYQPYSVSQPTGSTTGSPIWSGQAAGLAVTVSTPLTGSYHIGDTFYVPNQIYWNGVDYGNNIVAVLPNQTPDMPLTYQFYR